MELGTLCVRSQHQNLLHQAVHKDNGLAWSDGQAIYLAPISITNGEMENQAAVKLGEFDRGVKSVHWSDNIEEGLCYMCVVHDKTISIWKVEGTQPKLTFKQVRKVNVQPLQQGCLWCPGRDILCVLCRDQCSLYYSHLCNKGSHVLPHLESETVTCGTWLTDGSRLVICTGTSLQVFSWSALDKSITNYTSLTWNVPGLDGYITTAVPVSPDKVLFAAEIPLESLCKQKDAFILPDLLKTQSNGRIDGDLGDGDIIRPKPSVTETLFNLPKTHTQSGIQDTCQLACVQFGADGEAKKVSGSKVKGILTPDILLYEPRQKLIIVGSNCQTRLQVFTVGDKQLTKTAEIELGKEDRAKGAACLPVEGATNLVGILLLIGRKSSSDSAFLSSSSYSNMKCVLKFFTIKSGQGLSDKKKVTQSVSVPNLTYDPKNGYPGTPTELPKRPLRKKKSISKPHSTSTVGHSSGDSVEQGTGGDNSGKSSLQQTTNYVEQPIRAQYSDRVESSAGEVHSVYSDISCERKGDVSSSTTSSSTLPNVLRGSKSLEHLKLMKDEVTSNSSGENSPREITLHMDADTDINGSAKIVPVGSSSPINSSLEIETTDFSSQKCTFKNSDYQSLDGQHSALVEEYLTQKQVVKQQQMMSSSANSSSSLEPPARNQQGQGHVESLEEIESQLREQNITITKLMEQMSNLSRRVDESAMVFPTRYQTLNKPELIHVCFRCSDGFEVKKKFVLDNGRLQLEPIKQAFSLETVELIIDEEACVTGCNIDGYIPMRFTPGSTLFISGKPAV